MFTNRENEYYKDLCKKIGADFFVDKSKGYEQLPGIIASLPPCSTNSTPFLTL